MESLSDLKKELTEWLEEFIRTAVDEGNKDLMNDLDTRFKSLEDGINELGITVGDVSKDVGGVANSLTGLAQQIIAIPAGIAQTITDTIKNLNPFHFP